MQDEDHRLIGADALAVEDRIEAPPVAAEGAERIDDARRPVDAGDVAAANSRPVGRLPGYPILFVVPIVSLGSSSSRRVACGSPRQAKAVSTTNGRPSSS